MITDEHLQGDLEFPEWIFIEIQGGLVPYACRREDCFYKDNQCMVVFLKGLTNKDLTSELIDCAVFFPDQNMETQSDSGFDFPGLIGFTVSMKAYSEEGEVVDWMDIPDNPLLVIQWREKEILLPARDQFVISVDYDNKQILVEPPDGLMEIE